MDKDAAPVFFRRRRDFGVFITRQRIINLRVVNVNINAPRSATADNNGKNNNENCLAHFDFLGGICTNKPRGRNAAAFSFCWRF